MPARRLPLVHYRFGYSITMLYWFAVRRIRCHIPTPDIAIFRRYRTGDTYRMLLPRFFACLRIAILVHVPAATLTTTLPAQFGLFVTMPPAATWPATYYYA